MKAIRETRLRCGHRRVQGMVRAPAPLNFLALTWSLPNLKEQTT